MDKDKEQTGQGFNNSRGEISDKKDVPKNNGQNLDNDPAHHRGNEKAPKQKKATQR